MLSVSSLTFFEIKMFNLKKTSIYLYPYTAFGRCYQLEKKYFQKIKLCDANCHMGFYTINYSIPTKRL